MSPKKKTAAVQQTQASNKVRVELRLDPDVFDQVKEKADLAGITVNQLIGGLTQWGARHLQVGEPNKRENGYIYGTRMQEGCLWAGELGTNVLYSKETIEEMRELGADCDPGDTYEDDKRPGKVFCFLDFTERRVVREDD
ncbi:hypothetical protein [Lacunimicrobium album]